MGLQEAEMLHRFCCVEDTKAADDRFRGIFEIENIFEGEFFEVSSAESRDFGGGKGQGIWPSGSDGSRPRAMTRRRPVGQRNFAIFSIARGRRAAGRAWSVLASNTKWKARRQVEGGSRRLAATYSTVVVGKRLRQARIAVSEMSKAVVWNPQAASCSASSPKPQPIVSAAFPAVGRGCAFQKSSKRELGQRLAHGITLFPASPSW